MFNLIWQHVTWQSDTTHVYVSILKTNEKIRFEEKKGKINLKHLKMWVNTCWFCFKHNKIFVENVSVYASATETMRLSWGSETVKPNKTANLSISFSVNGH